MSLKHIVNNSQDNISQLKPQNPNTVGPEYCNKAEAQDKYCKIVFITMLVVPK